MTSRWLTRALVAVAVPALLVPVAATSATAAPKPPAVPTIDAVAEIYPHLAGGEVDVSRQTVRDVGKGCSDGAKVKGAVGREATYLPAMDVTGEAPWLDLVVESLPSVGAARGYTTRGIAQFARCIKGDDPDLRVTKITKFHVGLGDQHAGYRVTAVLGKTRVRMSFVVVRAGNRVVQVTTASRTAPSIPKTIDLARLALETAG